jgi:hypothetical protein
MPENRIVQFLLQFLFSTIGCLLFRAAGLLLLSLAGKRNPNEDKGFLGYFYPLFHGITFCIALYAVIRSGLLSVHLLVLGAYLVWLVKGSRGWGHFSFGSAIAPLFARWLEVAGICLLFTGIFHFLPESEYKQNDSFFYLKMAESLNSTGQENVHLYNNLFDPSFHGVEPYHYAEMWLNALLLRGAGYFLPGIQVFRYIGYTVLSVCVLYGFWGVYEVFSGRRAGWWAQLFCVAFLFFLPDILDYSSFLRHYVVFGFDNNYLERINFRTIYLYLIPVLLSCREEGGREEKGPVGGLSFETVLYFVCLSVVSYLCFLVLIPATLIFVLLGFALPGLGVTRRVLVQKGLLAGGTALFFGLFYGLFSNKEIGGFYRGSWQELFLFLKGHSFYILSSFLTTLAYIVGIVFVYTGFIWTTMRDQAVRFCWEYRLLLTWVAVVSVTGVGMARILTYQDNAYQLAFLGYVLAAWFIFIFWCRIFAVMRGSMFRTAGIMLFLAGYILFKVREGKAASTDVFRSGNSTYSKGGYTEEYIGKVTAFVKGRNDLLGGYLGDSSYYRQMNYFSLRNPNVYFPPISYIMAGRDRSNYEFCLSDSAAILTDIDRNNSYETGYLEDAIRRSGFYIYRKKAGLERREALHRFISGRHLQYLIVSGRSCEAEIEGIDAEQRLRDPSTGELFLVLKTGD